MRPLFRTSIPKAWPLVLALCGAMATTLVTVFSGTPEIRLAEHDRLVAEARMNGHAMARATLGRAFLEVPQVDRTAYLTQSGLEGLDRGLDPAVPSGGLYPLRKAIEQLASFLMWPFIIIAILHALVRGQGAADKKLLDVGVRFFTVVALLWIYPIWDLVLYRGVAIPLTTTLTQGEVVRDITRAVARVGGRTDWERFGDVATTPTEALSQFNTYDAACASELEVGGGDPRAAKICLGPEVDYATRAMHARSIEGYFQGSDSAKANQLLLSQDPEIANTFLEHNSRARGNSWWKGFGDFFMQHTGLGGAATAYRVLANPSEWLSSTVVGILLQLQALIANVALWFIWLGVLMARVFSLSLAPIALAWGLMPGGLTKAEKWFTGHATIVLMPIGFAFGLLLFYAIQVAIFATDMMTNAVLGVGIRLAMLLALITVLFKSGSLSKLIAGDVTSVAKDFGDATRNRTIQLAAAATAVAGGAALAGGGAFASSATAAKLAGGAKSLGVKAMARPAAVMDRMTRAVTGNRMGASDLAVRLGLKKGVEGDMSRDTTRRSRVARAAWDAVTDTARVARATVTGGAAAGKKYGWDTFGGGNVTPAAMRQFFTAPVMDAYRHIKESRTERQTRPTYTTDSTAELLRDIPEESGQRKETLKKLGLKLRDFNAHDLQFLVDNLQVDDLRIAGRKWSDLEQGRRLGKALLEHAMSKGVRISATANPDGTVSPDQQTVADLSRLIETDEEFRALVMDDAKSAFGHNKIPMVQGRHGQILDVGAWASKSMAATNAIAIAAVVQERLDREQYRRTLLSVASGSEPSSLQEIAAHHVNRDIAQLLPGEDQRQFEKRIEEDTLRVLRMVWYEFATEQERVAAGLRPTGDHASAAEHAGIDVSAWRQAGSAATEDLVTGRGNIPMSAVVETVRQMGAAHWAQMERVLNRKASMGGHTYGIDEIKFKTRREHSYSYMPDSVMDQLIQHQPELKHDMERAYRDAVQEALRQFANQLPKRLATETVDEYVRRIAPEVNNFVFLDPHSAHVLSGKRAAK